MACYYARSTKTNGRTNDGTKIGDPQIELCDDLSKRGKWWDIGEARRPYCGYRTASAGTVDKLNDRKLECNSELLHVYLPASSAWADLWASTATR